MKSNKIIRLSILIVNFIVIFTIICLMLNGEHLKDKNIPKASKGFLDLTNWDFYKDGIVDLGGEWEFYDKQMLTSEDFKESEMISNNFKKYMLVPSSNSKSNPKELLKEDFGTYRLIMKIKNNNEIFGLKISNIRMSHKLYLNGKLLGKAGIPSEKEQLYKPENTPYMTYFNVNNDSIEIILQIANFTYFKGGIINNIKFGLQQDINRYTLTRNSFDLAAIILLFLLAIYHLWVFYMINEDKSLLYCGLYFLLLGANNFFNGEKLFMQLFKEVPFEIAYKLQSFPAIISVILFALFLNALGKNLMPKKVVKIVATIATIFLSALLILTYKVYTSIYYIYFGFIISFLLYVFLNLIKEYIKKEHGDLDKKGLGQLIIAVAFLFISSFDMIMYSYNFRNKDIIGRISFFGFIIMLALMSAYKYANNYKNIEMMNECLKGNDMLKDEFLTKTSHEIKTPLQAIINISNTILEKNNEGLLGKQNEDIKLIKKISEKLSNVVNNLIDLSLLKNGALSVKVSVVDAVICTKIIIDVFADLLKEKNINLLNGVEGNTYIMANEYRICQVLYNLMNNVVKYTQNGTIKISSYKKDAMVYISVENSNSSIDVLKFETIIKEYDYVNNAKCYEHESLDLFISCQLAELMKGKIYLKRSDTEKITGFMVAMPISNKYINSKYEGSKIVINEFMKESSSKKIETLHGNKNTILIVDDEIANIEELANIFSMNEYNILTAVSGEEALTKIKTYKVDLVILDIFMSGMSGLEVCKKIRVNYSIFDLPILITTSRNTYKDIDAVYESGANDFVIKPFGINEIRARVKTLITMKASADEALKNEMAFLQAQIKPHFLFNTISTVISFIDTDSEQASELLIDFSKYLRIIFNSDNNVSNITLQKELELVKAFINIEIARFGERVKVEFYIEETLLAIKIPPLIIQPLVENAIRHGICKKEEGGTVKVSIKGKDGFMYISVEDNGVGMSDEIIELLTGEDKLVNGIGFFNVKRRINRILGSNLEIDSNLGEGTNVKLSFKI